MVRNGEKWREMERNEVVKKWARTGLLHIQSIFANFAC